MGDAEFSIQVEVRRAKKILRSFASRACPVGGKYPGAKPKLQMTNFFYPRSKINEHEHLALPLRVHALLPDFELEDVWRVPISLTSAHSLQLLMDQFSKSNTNVTKTGITGFLFKVRLFAGRLFKWDEKPVRDHHQLVPGSIRDRYANQENLKYDDLPDPGSGSFIPVYKLENEFLSEIENRTVHGALHLSRVPLGHDTWTIHMAVYVKPKGWFGRFYMWIITPFRLWIVYPSLMKAARKSWEAYLKKSKF